VWDWKNTGVPGINMKITDSYNAKYEILRKNTQIMPSVKMSLPFKFLAKKLLFIKR